MAFGSDLVPDPDAWSAPFFHLELGHSKYFGCASLYHDWRNHTPGIIVITFKRWWYEVPSPVSRR